MTFIKVWTLQSNREQYIRLYRVTNEKAEAYLHLLSDRCLRDASVIDYEIHWKHTPFKLTADDYKNPLTWLGRK